MRWLVVSLCLIVMVAAFSCTGTPGRSETRGWMKETGKPKVLSTVSMIDDLVAYMGGDTIDHLVLIPGQLDPHSYELVKGDSEKLGRADVIFYNGLGLEHGASIARYLHTSDSAVAVGDWIVDNDPHAVVVIGGEVDPHIWTDVELWSRTIDPIRDELIRLQPAYADLYRQRAEGLRAELRQVDREMRAAMDRVPVDHRYLVTSHDAFNYFTRRYLASNAERENGRWVERCTAPEGLSPEGQLSATDIKNIISHLQRYNVHVLFPESNLSRDSIVKVVEAGRSKGLEVHIATEPLYADAMGPKGSDADTYAKMMRHNMNVIAGNLAGSR